MVVIAHYWLGIGLDRLSAVCVCIYIYIYIYIYTHTHTNVQKHIFKGWCYFLLILDISIFKCENNEPSSGFVNFFNETKEMRKFWTFGPGGLGPIPDRIIPKTLKLVLVTSLLNTQQYKVCIKGKVEQSRERNSASPTPQCSSYWKGSLLVALDYRETTLLIYVSGIPVSICLWLMFENLF